MPDVEGERQRALAAMVEKGWPSVTVGGSYWYFDHVGGLREVRSVTTEHSGVTIEAFRRQYADWTGRKWRG